ncbi:MAG: transposase [Anaerolineales bacterium]|nr:transposase [Anaerolineales bacterium]
MNKNDLSEFRNAVYQKVRYRPDAILDLIDALTIAGQVSSPVAVSESPLFRRKFSSVYDVMLEGEIEVEQLRDLLVACQPAESETIAGYEVYATDATPNERMTAETLPDRGVLKAQQNEPVRYGHKYSWLVRLVQSGTSWVAPVDVQRINTKSTDTKLAAEQVQALARRNPRPKVITADSRYRDRHFLGIFDHLENTFALVRLQNNQKLSQVPVPKPANSRGAPRKHGADFQLSAITCSPDASEEFFLGKQKVRVTAWHKLHFKRFASVVGTVVCVEFLKEDGTPRYKRPIWLFWTGPEDVTLQNLCRMYLWRFAIEHLFRFLKQHMGLNCNRSPDLVSTEKWMWLCALAYWQLLLMRNLVTPNRPAWHPRRKNGQVCPLTPAQVQRSALAYLLQSGTPARNTRPAGKGQGRQKSYRPPPRTRYAVVFKTKKPQNRPAIC